MDTTYASRRGRSNHINSSDYSRPVDNQKKEQHQNNSKNDSILVSQRYHSSRERKIIFGFLSFVLAYIYILNVSIGNIGKENITKNAIWTPDALGRTTKEQSKTNARHQLTKLRPTDYEQYTIRMNTWRRPKQLIQSVKHHASCPGVKEIQIVWCDKENEPPPELLEMTERKSPISSSSSDTRVVIERHEVNSLNERFNILEPTPTLGILSIDDDVLRPCEAIDSGFFKWLKSPHRMVGFDARTHVENDDGSWQYGYLSTTKKENMYSLSLTRYCFIHRDYLNWYTRDLPSTILDTVATKFNCEDIAMSFMISSLTQGHPPLLADLWAMNSQLKLDVDVGISASSTHKKFRDSCLDSFASLFGLKDKDNDNQLQKAEWIHRTKSWFFKCGAQEDDNDNVLYTKSNREIGLERKWEKLRRSEDKEHLKKYLVKLASEAGEDARANGLLSTKK
jgi:glucuronyl/N-acetylglucosaminyl transferase EXT2